MRARLARIALLIEQKGLERVREPHFKHVERRLWEMRMQGRSGISRGALRYRGGPTRRNPRHEIDLALTRAKLIKTTGK
jgi:hypothetical protein